MIVKATERSTYLDVSKIDWEPTKFAGVWTKPLYEDSSGRQTTLTKMAPGARLPRHRHVGIEQSYVLEGTLVDEDGACAAGNFVWRRAGSVHEAWSPDGCVVLGVFEKPNEFLSTAP
jgi:anti-sigma factor ChrR (cupin superfamily)